MRIGVLLLLLVGYGRCFSQLDKPASEAFVRRVVGDRAASFVVEYIPAVGGKDVFELKAAQQTALASLNRERDAIRAALRTSGSSSTIRIAGPPLTA